LSDFLQKIGELLRIKRKELGLSQEQLGELSGLHNNYIGAIERGEKNITIESLYKVTRALNLSLEELFRGIDPDLNIKDDLGELIKILSFRQNADASLILNLAKSIFTWEKTKT
jgi:XRE family transcriptional regulator, regulator of sulfur utilization